MTLIKQKGYLVTTLFHLESHNWLCRASPNFNWLLKWLAWRRYCSSRSIVEGAVLSAVVLINHSPYQHTFVCACAESFTLSSSDMALLYISLSECLACFPTAADGQAGGSEAVRAERQKSAVLL